MRPLLKWPGGKRDELPMLRPLYPAAGLYERFVEPFAGGAASFWDLEPDAGWLNDINLPLISLYRMLGTSDKDFASELRLLVAARTELAERASSLARAVLEDGAWHALVADPAREISRTDIQEQVLTWNSPLMDGVAMGQVANWGAAEQLDERLMRAMADKLARIGRKVRQGVEWAAEDIINQAATGLHAGLYTFLRDDVDPPMGSARHTALFIYEREFAYGGMFRYNKQGRFNIPYGGASYNSKDFSRKVERLLSAEVRDQLARTRLTLGDFDQVAPETNADDFVFLDPPYDSDFTDYAGHEFASSDQARLARYVHETKARVMVVIARTDLIDSLYKAGAATGRSPLRIVDYEKQYSYNVRGRNDRDVTHLAIMNYPESEQAGS
jgi:DNA adenine methylase